MTRILLTLLLLIPLANHAAIRLPGDSGSGRVVPIDRIVAVVNDDVIVQSELDYRLNIIRKRLRKANTRVPEPKVLARRVLEKMIIDKLQLQLARRTGIRVSDELLNRTIRNIARRNGMTLKAFRQVLKKEGIPFAEFRENIRKEMIIARLQQRNIRSRIRVSKQEIERFLAGQKNFGRRRTRFKISHILVAVPEAASPEQIRRAREKALSLRKQILAGGDFAELAVISSDGPRALDGGNLGWMRPAQIPPLFARALRGMQAGQISPVLRSASGFHIIRLDAVKGQDKHIVRQTKVRHILIRTNKIVSDSIARTRLNDLRSRILAGEKFADIARAHSQDTLSAQKGGSLDWVNPGQLVPAFEKAMNALKPGEISKPVKTRFGWHIIQVEARRKRDDTEQFKRVTALRLLKARKFQEALQLWLRRLRDESHIEYRI